MTFALNLLKVSNIGELNRASINFVLENLMANTVLLADHFDRNKRSVAFKSSLNELTIEIRRMLDGSPQTDAQAQLKMLSRIERATSDQTTFIQKAIIQSA